MCGIAGAINFKLPYDIIKNKMLHRGPDEQNGYTGLNIDFFHLRLSIVDAKGGRQPMHLNDTYTIIFNGEIYNHLEVRSQLGLIGKTSSDTETLLLLYQKFGTGFLQYLDGMFAFAIYDKIKNTIFIARDRAGKKPLYYYTDKEKFVFASELNCLKGLLPLQMDDSNFYSYLRLGTFYRTQTPYKNVTELQAGSYLEIDCATLKIVQVRWWDINKYYSKNNLDDFEKSLNVVDSMLNSAVKRRIISSDLEVGCFLSGGIDSGLTTAIASQYSNKLKTFTVSFDGEYDEAPLAKLVADKYGTDHTEIKVSFNNLKNDLEGILTNYGEPFFDSSAIPSFYVSREAKRHLTVILNGDGADELFGGYRRYVAFSKYNFFNQNTLLKSGAGALKKLLPPSNNKKSKYNYLYRLASLASKSELEIYLSAGVDIFEDFEQYIISPGGDYMRAIREDFNAITSTKLSGLKKIMCMDFNTNLFSDLLVKMDIATMANSLEGRSPFMAKELLEYVPGMNDSFKINKNTTKYLLRTLAKRYLPEQLINQPKRGFEIPLKSWINDELKEVVFDYLNDPNALHRAFIKKNFTEQLLNKKLKMSEEKRAKILWTILCMEIWYKKTYLNA
jgi:asparagine synthase (glutamine-hydrolysing)